MHPALHIDEVLDAIFTSPTLRSQAIDSTSSASFPSAEEVYRRHPLLALALTCKTMHEPATRVLWEQIDGIDRLVRTMSRDVIGVVIPYVHERRAKGQLDKFTGRLDLFRDSSEESISFGLRRPTGRYIEFIKEPTERDWKIFDRYAAYVREFGNPETGTDKFKLEESVHRALRARFSGNDAPILPRLRKLICGGCRQFRYASLLLSPQLHTLEICRSHHDCCFTCVNALIADLKNSSMVNLRTMYLSAYVSQEFHSKVSEFLMSCGREGTGLKKLQVLSVPVTTDVIKLALRGKGFEEINMRVITLDLDDIFDNTERPCRWNIRKFAIKSETTVKDAEIGGALEDRFYSKVVSRLGAPGLTDFEFQGGPQHPFAQDIQAFLEILSTNKGSSDGEQAQGMFCIRFTPIKNNVYIPPPRPLPEAYICTFANALHTLCQPWFSQLRTLDLYDAFVDLADEELGMLAKSMPHLQSLTVCAAREGRARERSRTTLVGLWLLAKHCRSIEWISMWIDASLDWDVFQTLGGFTDDLAQDDEDTRWEWLAKGRNEHLHLLYVGDSTIQEEEVVVEFIKLVFPGIQNLCYDHVREQTHESVMWRTVRHELL